MDKYSAFINKILSDCFLFVKIYNWYKQIKMIKKII